MSRADFFLLGYAVGVLVMCAIFNLADWIFKLT